MITPAGAQHSETMEGSAEEATSGDPDDSPSVFGLTEYDGAPAESVAAHDEPPKLADKASSRPTKGPRKLADKVAPTAANPEVMELNQAMLAEQEARDRLQRLKAMAPRHIVSAAARPYRYVHTACMCPVGVRAQSVCVVGLRKWTECLQLRGPGK